MTTQPVTREQLEQVLREHRAAAVAEYDTIDLTERVECALCDDRGYVTTHAEHGEYQFTFTDPCPRCSL